MKCEKKYRCHKGYVEYYVHDSKVTNSPMRFSLYRPDKLKRENKALLWLSGLTCTEENFQIKAGASRFLGDEGILLICPDTSPRGLNLPGENDSYDFGSGAGFYIDSTKAPWSSHYKMESYIIKELLPLLGNLPGIEASLDFGILGHSMGGHGALTLGLKYPKLFSSVSAFSPILNPSACPWGQKVFAGYLGDNEDEWKEHDFLELLKNQETKKPIRIDQGLDDEFLKTQLGMEALEQYLNLHPLPNIHLYKHEGHDHSYYFISSFIEEHLGFHLSC